MKIERSFRIPGDATITRGELRRLSYKLFLWTVAVAVVGTIASSRGNQGSLRLSNALPGNIILVTNTNDSGPGSLRDALAVATDGDMIDATGVSGTITLISGELNVDKDVIVSGPGANHLAVDGNAQSRVLFINAGKTVTISGLTITNGNVTNDWGGGISNVHGTLTVSNCIISGNSRGGILNDEGALTVGNCTISGNSGGGIFSGTSPSGVATLTITNSTISGNSAAIYGGGILNAGSGSAMLTITDSTISGNSADYGGGICNVTGGSQGGAAIVTLSNSTVNDNSAVGDGGGIYNSAGRGLHASLTVENSTISNNSTNGNGGGVYNAAGGTFGGADVTVINSTLSANSASANGGGTYNTGVAGGSASLALGNTILNAGTSGENIFNDAAAVNSLGYNVSSDDGGGLLTGPGDQTETDPLLGSLRDNGGPTLTHALLPGSPAIDTGDPSFSPPPAYDQRGPGFDRVVNGRIDIGSFEVQGPRAATPTPTPRPSPTPRPRPTVHPRPLRND